MKKDHQNRLQLLILLLFVLLGIILRIDTSLSLNFRTQATNFFYLGLLNIDYKIPWALIIICGLFNIAGIFYLGQKIFKQQVGFIAASLYAVSPWSIYLDISTSIYVFYLSVVLSLFICTINLSNTKKRLWTWGFLVTLTVLFYTNFMLGLLTFILSSGYLFVEKNKSLKTVAVVQLILLIPLIVQIFLNKTGFMNMVTHEFNFFSDIGMVNTANIFQGELMKEGVYTFGKFFENKYSYFLENLFKNLLTHLVPVTYFSSQYRLLGFSENPPIYVGLLIPFVIGFVKTIKTIGAKKKLFFIFLYTTIISVFSYPSPDLQKCFLISPLLFLLIGLGINDLFKHKGLLPKICLFIIFMLIVLQFTLTIIDISTNEPLRYLTTF